MKRCYLIYLGILSITLFFILEFSKQTTFIEKFTSKKNEPTKSKEAKAKELLEFTKVAGRIGNNVNSVKERFMAVPNYVSSFIPRPRFYFSLW
jgi:hypothetical protein